MWNSVFYLIIYIYGSGEKRGSIIFRVPEGQENILND